MKEQIFDEENFFKSHELNTEGKLLEKAIPTVEHKNTKTEVKKKIISKDVVNFKKKIEDAFKIINDTVKDLQTTKKSEWREKDCAKMVADYYAFKSTFQSLINDQINYPYKEDEVRPVLESEYDKSRIKI